MYFNFKVERKFGQTTWHGLASDLFKFLICQMSYTKKKSSLKLLNELYANFSGTLFDMFYRKMPNFCLISQTRIYRDNSNFWIISETFWPSVEAKKVPFCSDLSNNMLPEAIKVSDYSNTKNLWNSKFKWFVRFYKFLLGYVVLSVCRDSSFWSVKKKMAVMCNSCSWTAESSNWFVA
jgi:hypothetical protein